MTLLLALTYWFLNHMSMMSLHLCVYDICASADYLSVYDVSACLHCTVQHLKYSSHLGNYWLLPNLGDDWLLPVSVAIGHTPQ